ncbi:hypothetical protein F4821DRAFT_107987 [Hypoxylon rubiginosum]|uniref:Uncharacterized protein n=1 Tax=Hypoxylon rubiginosum TaxID=110542 RepID=A0ACC0D3U2_9PEZI|nr:hypothetical protein F4821DRAFT_107987 [Hypoxylon rubiginosum]
MATNSDSERAVCYLNQVTPDVPEVVQRPNVEAPLDMGYNLDRYINSHLHAEDQHLRPPQSPTPLTEAESRARMAAILGSIVLDTTSKPN